MSGYENYAGLQQLPKMAGAVPERPETQIERLNGALRMLKERLGSILANTDQNINRITSAPPMAREDNLKSGSPDASGPSLNEALSRVEALQGLTAELADQISRLTGI